MADQKSAAEAELQKAESAAHKLHPLLTQGNDGAPVTRGELKTVLGDLLGKLAAGGPIEVKSDEVGKMAMALNQLTSRVHANEQALAKLNDSVGKLVGFEFDLKHRVDVLEGKGPAPDPAAAAPASPAAGGAGSSSAPGVDLNGAEDLAKFTVQQLKDMAALNNIDISSVEGHKKEVLVDFLAAALNLMGK